MFWRFSHIFLLSLTNQKSTFQRKLYGVLSHCFNISSWNIHESYSALPRKSFQIVLVVWKHENKNNWRENKKKLEEREFETEKILRIKSFKICPKSFMLMTKETLFVRLIKFYEFMWHATYLIISRDGNEFWSYTWRHKHKRQQRQVISSLSFYLQKTMNETRYSFLLVKIWTCLWTQQLFLMDLILFSIVIVTLFLACLPFFKNYKKQLDFRNLLNKIPGPKAYPLFGTTLAYIMTKREGTNCVVCWCWK